MLWTDHAIPAIGLRVCRSGLPFFAGGLRTSRPRRIRVAMTRA